MDGGFQGGSDVKAKLDFLLAYQCVKLTLARSPMATIYHHLVTYFSFPGAILGDKASGWLGCAAHSMRDITREPMQPSEKARAQERV